jgi:protein-tyrosine phosphatase
MAKTLDMSPITDWLYVGRTPRRRDYRDLQDKGITMVINMRAERPFWPKKQPGLIQDVWVPSLDAPLCFVDQRRLLATAKRAQQVIQNGGKVYVFCRRGRHRSVAMAAAILMLQGYKHDDLTALFAKKRPVADLTAYQVRRALKRFETRLAANTP